MTRKRSQMASSRLMGGTTQSRRGRCEYCVTVGASPWLQYTQLTHGRPRQCQFEPILLKGSGTVKVVVTTASGRQKVSSGTHEVHPCPNCLLRHCYARDQVTCPARAPYRPTRKSPFAPTSSRSCSRAAARLSGRRPRSARTSRGRPICSPATRPRKCLLLHISLRRWTLQ
jgi:hypothetical protein